MTLDAISARKLLKLMHQCDLNGCETIGLMTNDFRCVRLPEETFANAGIIFVGMKNNFTLF